METWWDACHTWTVALEMQERKMRRRCCPLCVRGPGVHGLLSMDEEPTESVRILKKTGKGDIKVGVCYWPPEQHEKVDQALYRHIGAASLSQVLVLTGDFNHSYICWRNNTARHKQSTRELRLFSLKKRRLGRGFHQYP